LAIEYIIKLLAKPDAVAIGFALSVKPERLDKIKMRRLKMKIKEFNELIQIFPGELPAKSSAKKSELLYYLRLVIKYTLFDLEATKRELNKLKGAV
jgi:hypothetical protein